MSEWTLEFGGDDPTKIDALIGSLVDDHMVARMSANQRGAAAWFRANGDRERAHTTGVFLKRPRVRGAAPILAVYVDSHAMVTDFGVNKDIYLARLANVGFAVSGIEFLPSREGRRTRQQQGQAPQMAPTDVLPALDAREAAEAERLVADLPEALRPSALKAVTNSMRQRKHERTILGREGRI